MRRSPVSPTLTMLLLVGFATSGFAQHLDLTDARRMDFAGPVKSVSTTTSNNVVRWQQPGGPTLVFPIYCRECEFDSSGNQTKVGQIINGSFQGETIRIVMDGQGHVMERVVENASTGEIVRHEIVGPFGKTEESSYRDGELQSRVLVSYDQYGHMTESLTLDAAGNQLDPSVVNTDKDGNDTERWDWRGEGQLFLHFRQTCDPKTQNEQFTSFDSFGGVKLTWTMTSGKLSSFWELPEAQSQFGDSFSEDVDNDTSENYDCQGAGECDISRIHYVYLDPKRRNPQSAEWRDESGNLLYAAYYEYEIDDHRNWTHRKIWVWSASLGQRTLYETDSRSISYWPQ